MMPVTNSGTTLHEDGGRLFLKQGESEYIYVKVYERNWYHELGVGGGEGGGVYDPCKGLTHLTLQIIFLS